MTKVLISEENLTNIANAIRAKNNTEELYTPSEMSEAILSIVSGNGRDSVPIGVIVPYGGSEPPNDWLLCNGQELSRLEYADLFAIIGTSYGAGNGSTTFNLPDKRGKVSVGLNGNDTDFNLIGKIGGEKEHTLTVDEMPKHDHALNNYNNGGNTAGHGVMYGWELKHGDEYYQNFNNPNMWSDTSGNSEPHNNLQPYQVDNWIIKVKQSTINQIAYSSEEQVIGTWFGKPLYKKTYVATDLNVRETFVKLDETVEKVTNFYGNIIFRGTVKPIPAIDFSYEDGITICSCSYLPKTESWKPNNFYMVSSNDNSKIGGYDLTVEYTKTTD